MNWNVTIDFTRGPSFGMVLPAETAAGAIKEARNEARALGFDAPVKKVTARAA